MDPLPTAIEHLPLESPDVPILILSTTEDNDAVTSLYDNWDCPKYLINTKIKPKAPKIDDNKSSNIKKTDTIDIDQVQTLTNTSYDKDSLPYASNSSSNTTVRTTDIHELMDNGNTIKDITRNIMTNTSSLLIDGTSLIIPDAPIIAEKDDRVLVHELIVAMLKKYIDEDEQSSSLLDCDKLQQVVDTCRCKLNCEW